MSRITAATVSLIDLEVETVRTDATQSFVKQETILVTLTTDEGLTGTGYSYTIGTGGRSITALLRESLLPLMIGAQTSTLSRHASAFTVTGTTSST